MNNIRNFCIIAHIDHGKSTLADRILELTGAVETRDMQNQLLDSMDLERERGITIKLQAVNMPYIAENGNEYVLNLIDTPGHVDFSYEVSRSLAACEGALLVIDAAQGIEAQTLANVYLALENDLTIIPVINKIDLPGADPERVKKQLEEEIGIDASEALLISAKVGTGVKEVLEAVVEKIPAPEQTSDKELRALIFDSHYDSYRGVIAYIRVVDGEVKASQKIKMMATNDIQEVSEVGVFTPKMKPVKTLKAGEVGYLITGVKEIKNMSVGDTITNANNPAPQALPGYRKATPMVYCGLYPTEGPDYEFLKDALEKLQLNDASLIYEPETSVALGFGFRCGFLGLLHMEIIQERLEREYQLSLIATAPGVAYKVNMANGDVKEIENPSLMPPVKERASIEEPYVKATIYSPDDYIGNIMEITRSRRGIFKDMQYGSDGKRVTLIYEIPLAEILYDFFDQLKSKTRGYASFDYEFIGYRVSDLVKLDILVNAENVDALSMICHKETAYYRGRKVVEKLRKLLPRKQFAIPLQAAIGQKIIARETISALRKDVLSKCYGGDISRKRKLLEKQREGKKRMKQLGSVEIPQEAFLAVLQVKENDKK
ncbi:elongation factor 4 [Clostridium sp. 'deep sea']|uniref:translation elongation factor 4 n=1 Tax=Clostridium sp. 'deep sea' TaxID=2779445 RepID=UPI0018969717|nr:translation elongation factor 4 [Clostridium sp. 'deep sea']QOR34342.1 elongation factor 4 [Clostridium sp. 'deep sea']